MQTFFCSCPRGLEGVLENELHHLGISLITRLPGGVQFKGRWEHCYQVNVESRVASRVLWEIDHGPYRHEQDIYHRVARLPWATWFSVRNRIKVNVKGKDCPLRSLSFMTLRIKDAICDSFVKAVGSRPFVDTRTPDFRIYAYLNQRNCTLYVDTSGEPLFKRGIRVESGDAPIRENLAAGLLALAGWSPGEPLLDPMCGSGTILMEAAQIARRIAPGLNRHFAFEQLHDFHSAVWEELVRNCRSRQLPCSTAHVYGYDRDEAAVEMAQANAHAAGLSQDIVFQRGDIIDCEPLADHGYLITNPPYGIRSGEADELAKLYPEIGHRLKRSFPGWKAYFLTADSRLPTLMRLAPSRRTPLFNGDLECRFFEFKMIRGGNRKSVRQEPLVHSCQT